MSQFWPRNRHPAPRYRLLKCVHTGTYNMGSAKGVFVLKSVHQGALVDARRPHSRSHACSFARNAVSSVCVCPQVHMATNKCALATITGRPRGVDQNAPEVIRPMSLLSLVSSTVAVFRDLSYTAVLL